MIHFGTNGIRGKFDELNPELALKVAQGIGMYFNRQSKAKLSMPIERSSIGGKIGVARDARLTGECLEHSVISGLSSVGCEVVKFGIISSPTAEYMVRKLKLDGLTIITASHNPPEWNALKVVDGKGVAVSKERGGEIEGIVNKIKRAKWKNVKKVEKYPNASKDHINRIKKLLDLEKIKKRKPKVVLDCGNGAAATIAPELFQEIGCEVIEINSKLDGSFPNRPSEPTKKNVKELIELVKKEKADAGIAWDGDGDRVIFVDEKGEYIIGDKVFGISLLIELSGPETGDYRYVATTVATSKLVEDIASKYGKEVFYTEVGAPALSEAIASGKAGFGGEEVGGVIWPDISLAKDGIYTAAKMVEFICDRKLSDVLKEIPEYFLEKTKVRIENREKAFGKIEKIKEYAKNKKWKTIEVDGVRINFDDGWTIARVSGTEPVIRIFAEGKTKEKAKKLIEEIKKIIS